MKSALIHFLLASFVFCVAAPLESVGANIEIQFTPEESLIIQAFRKKAGAERCKEGREIADLLGRKYAEQSAKMTVTDYIRLLGKPDLHYNAPPDGEARLHYSLGHEPKKFGKVSVELVIRFPGKKAIVGILITDPSPGSKRPYF